MKYIVICALGYFAQVLLFALAVRILEQLLSRAR
jgi:hypothetical protein